jgi:DNA-directed RNA polymerase subunit RPC12/RpoP
MTCNNRGCGNTMEPYLDQTDDKVYCSKCDKEIVNVTIFTKNQMKSMKQFRAKKVISFAVKCQKCGKEDRPKLVKDDIVCPGCSKPHENLSEPFKIMLREKLKTVGQDV